MNQADIWSYLSYLALQQSVLSSTQNQVCYAPYPAAQLCRPFVDEQCEHQGDSGLLVLKNVEITMIYPRVLRNMANALKAPLDIIFSDKIE